MEPIIIIYVGFMIILGVVVVKKIDNNEKLLDDFYKKRFKTRLI